MNFTTATEGRTARMRAAALAAVLALALGAAACGSDDDGDGGGDSAAASGSTTSGGQASNGGGGSSSAAEGSGPEQQIRATYDAYLAGFNEDDLAAACATMTAKLQRQFGAGTTCEKRFEDLVGGQSLPKSEASIVKLDVNGKTAKADVKTKGSAVYAVRFTKTGDGWKISGGHGFGQKQADG
jgi:hypothetical protein